MNNEKEERKRRLINNLFIVAVKIVDKADTNRKARIFLIIIQEHHIFSLLILRARESIGNSEEQEGPSDEQEDLFRDRA